MSVIAGKRAGFNRQRYVVRGGIKASPHGTMLCYKREQCRCMDCRLAAKLYRDKEMPYNGNVRLWRDGIYQKA